MTDLQDAIEATLNATKVSSINEKSTHSTNDTEPLLIPKSDEVDNVIVKANTNVSSMTSNDDSESLNDNNNNNFNHKHMLMCRICHCEEVSHEFLITPCYCSGTLKYVHQACLQQWLKSNGTLFN